MMFLCFVFAVITLFMTGAQCEVTDVFAESGSQAVLPCHFSLSSSTPRTVIWSKANKGTVWRKQKSGLQYWGSSWAQKGAQRVQCPHTQFDRGDYSLEINNVSEDDGGVYSCVMEFGDKVSENIVVLRVIKVSVSQPVSIWGRDVSVTCNVTPWPYGASVRWMLNNRPFLNRDIPKSVVREKATMKLTGNWTCVMVFNGKEGRASATMSVKGIIQPSNDNTKVYTAVGSTVTLPCVFSPGLTPTLPRWEKVTPGRLPQALSTLSPSSQLSWDKSASLKEVGFEDEGRYRCSGFLEGQLLAQNMQLVVARIVSSNNKGVEKLTCQLSDTSEVTEYEWVRDNGTQLVVPVQAGKTLNISKVLEENQGEWTCRYYGKEGILGNVTYHVPLMSQVSGQKAAGSSHNTAAVIGLCLLLLVLLVILAQMYKNYQRRKRIFQYPALETIVHTVSNEREERERRQVKK
ncbi:contactin-2 [Mastacembelus armatus]|uniref:Contactin-2-like n=1 Tax=Mastacembelus armatus TaxID=205130 RepID=A0A3Q3L1A5_9TELE|nr:contactin-2-like [Mastacembelus armatus]